MTKLGTILIGATFLALAVLAAPAPSLSATLDSTAPSLCAANSSAAELPPFLSPALPKSLGPLPQQTCGACSDTLCRGAKEFGPCGTDSEGRVLSCSATAASCPADGLVRCSCQRFVS